MQAWGVVGGGVKTVEELLQRLRFLVDLVLVSAALDACACACMCVDVCVRVCVCACVCCANACAWRAAIGSEQCDDPVRCGPGPGASPLALHLP